MTEVDELFVRVDATPATGLGHFTRCFALAQHWRDLHGTVTFLGAFGPSERERLASEGMLTQPVDDRHPAPGDLPATLAATPPGSTIVLDGYDFDYAYQQALARDRRVLVIDDFGHQPAYAGAALLNPNFSAATIKYRRAPARRLRGPEYALLRRSFRQRTGTLSPRAGAVERLLVSLGGADIRNDTARMIRLIAEAAVGPLQMRVIVGPLNPHAAELEALAAGHAGIELRHAPPDIGAEMQWADFAIASAGSISAELAALGIPALLFSVADNQIAGARSIDAAGAARYGGDLRDSSDERIRSEIERTLRDAAAIGSMRSRGPALVDGDGVVRVCRFLREGA